MTELYKTREEKLVDAFMQRQQEVEDYQINIDNFALAIAAIDLKPEEEREQLTGFRSDLELRLAAERHEQSKAQIMLEVLKAQVPAA